MNIRIKCDGSKSVETILEIKGNEQLSVLTAKSNRGNVTTYVQFQKIENGNVTFMMFSDFSKRILSEKMRGTEKNLIAQHTKALEIFKQSEDYKTFFPESILFEKSENIMNVTLPFSIFWN